MELVNQQLNDACVLLRAGNFQIQQLTKRVLNFKMKDTHVARRGKKSFFLKYLKTNCLVAYFILEKNVLEFIRTLI